MWISWKNQDSQLNWPLSFEQKVELFYEQTIGWQLHIADLVANGGTAFGENGDRNGCSVLAIRHSGFAVLQICLSYFETIGHYTGQRSGSRVAFEAGVHEVFPSLANGAPPIVSEFVTALYKDARCGLYHNVRSAKVGLGFPPDGSAIAFIPEARKVVVSPERLPAALKAHLEAFRQRLLDQSDQALRDAFSTRFDLDVGTA